MNLKRGQKWYRDDGAYLRIDKVGKRRVCFVSWGIGRDVGEPRYMMRALFEQCLLDNRMVPRKNRPWQQIPMFD